MPYGKAWPTGAVNNRCLSEGSAHWPLSQANQMPGTSDAEYLSLVALDCRTTIVSH